MRTVSILGDSISTFEGLAPRGFAVYFEGERREACGLRTLRDTWWAKVIDGMGAAMLVNGSYSGSMVEGAGFPAGEAPERARALTCAGMEPDDILVFMGTNDYGWGSAAAQASGRSVATPTATDLSLFPAAEAGMTDAEGLRGFARAYVRMLENLHEACPRAEVWCMTLLPGRVVGASGPTFAWNLRGVPMAEYNRQIVRAAKNHGCQVLDVAGFGLDYEAVDGTHPTRLGMCQIAELVAAAMKSRAVDPEAFLARPGATWRDLEVWRSRDLCPGRSCVGCEHARDTGNTWSCVCEREL